MVLTYKEHTFAIALSLAVVSKLHMSPEGLASDWLLGRPYLSLNVRPGLKPVRTLTLFSPPLTHFKCSF